MFTGIVETTGVIEDLNYEKENLNLTIKSSISRDLRVDESVSHDGVCLTVTHNSDTSHKTTLVPETIKKSRFSSKFNKCLSTIFWGSISTPTFMPRILKLMTY